MSCQILHIRVCTASLPVVLSTFPTRIFKIPKVSIQQLQLAHENIHIIPLMLYFSFQKKVKEMFHLYIISGPGEEKQAKPKFSW